MLRKLIQAAAMIVLLPGVASAQSILNSWPPDKPAVTEEERERQRLIEKNYKSTIDKIPEKKPVDPWGNIRPNPAPSSATKQQRQ
jgi:hypothetical protein